MIRAARGKNYIYMIYDNGVEICSYLSKENLLAQIVVLSVNYLN